MTKIDLKEVQRLRAESGAGVMECRRALEESGGDYQKAKALLKERGLAKTAKKAGREANEGIVEAYIHGGGRIGALVLLASETDFVARNPAFRELAKELAMQVAAMAPASVDELLRQVYIRDASKTVAELVTTVAASTGENVRIRRIARFALGEGDGEPAGEA